MSDYGQGVIVRFRPKADTFKIVRFSIAVSAPQLDWALDFLFGP
jgi:hypothetical protein